MTRLLLALTSLLAGAASTAAQTSIAARVAAVRDGDIRMEYPARAQVCGDGRDVVAFRTAFFARDLQSWGGRWSDMNCKPGPVRVTLTKSAGELVHMRTQVGGTWREGDGKVTDFGVVNAREAAAYFFSAAESLDGVAEKGRVLLPAVLAADAEVVEPLRAIARNGGRSVQLRRQAIQWLGLAGDASVIPDLVSFARGGDAGEKKSLSGAAISALAGLGDDAGIPALLELSRDKSSSVRHDVVFWLGQTDDVRAIRRLHQVIDDDSEENRVRKNAIFALGQCEAVPTKDLITVFKTVGEPSLREQAIFALSQREDRVATDALMDIAKNDGDRQMRSKAMFWLAQKKDPRVAKMFGEILK